MNSIHASFLNNGVVQILSMCAKLVSLEESLHINHSVYSLRKRIRSGVTDEGNSCWETADKCGQAADIFRKRTVLLYNTTTTKGYVFPILACHSLLFQVLLHIIVMWSRQQYMCVVFPKQMSRYRLSSSPLRNDDDGQFLIVKI